MPDNVVIIRSNPGIKRDGTKFDGDFYTDGQWCRFQRGLPRKIGGYRSINKYLPEISRGFGTYAQSNLVYCHSGSASYLKRFTVDINKNSSIISDRTPATLAVSANNRWMFDYMYDSSASGNKIIAHVAPNGNDIVNATGGQIFYGDTFGTSALTPITIHPGTNVTGGIVVLHPYLVYFGTDGIVAWSDAGDPSNTTTGSSGQARVWSQKIIKGVPLRAGSGSAPAGLLWAYDAVIRMSYIGGSAVFQFDTIATETSIMSPDSVVDYDGVQFWAGIDRFLMFNGVVREVPNQMNMNYFFENLHIADRMKVFAIKVPRYGEIWWCYPRGQAAECTHAIIYNVRENSWYDTELPNNGRAIGAFTNAFGAPIMLGAQASVSGYKTWIHEQGVDEVDGTTQAPILSYFETADMSAIVNKGIANSLHIMAVEPDFLQSGPMSVQVTGRANARAPEIYSTEYSFPETASQPYEQIVVMREQRRELRLKFISNCVGGDYQMGQIVGHIDLGDGTRLG